MKKLIYIFNNGETRVVEETVPYHHEKDTYYIQNKTKGTLSGEFEWTTTGRVTEEDFPWLMSLLRDLFQKVT